MSRTARSREARPVMLDVLVAGGGPAGRALAGACAALGLRTGLADPSPDRPWRSTYAAWSAELPPLPDSAIASRSRGRAIAVQEHALGWEYTVLDTAGLRAHLDEGLRTVEIHRARLGEVPAHVVVDATGHHPSDAAPSPTARTARSGHARSRTGRSGRSGDPAPLPRTALSGRGTSRTGRSGQGGRRRVAAEQTAYGVVVDADRASPVVAPGEALFMDWRADHGVAGWPSFLYAVPLGGGAVLLEETSLARRPGLPLPELRARLHARLAHHGITVPPGARAERVRFPVDGPLTPSPRHLLAAATSRDRREWSETLGERAFRSTPDDHLVVGSGRADVAFGAAAPLVHPATGFSVATALSLAPRLAEALTCADPVGAARKVVWPASALAVHALRRRGLEALLRMPPEQVPGFFDVFFRLPERHRWAYLTGRTDLPGTLAAMGALYRNATWPLRARLVGPALVPRRRDRSPTG